MKPSVNRTTTFTLMVHGIELHAAFEERENKQKNANFSLKFIRVIFLFPQKCICNAILWEKKDNSKLYNVININSSCQCLQIKTFMSDFSSVYCSILSKMVCTFLDDFL